MSKVAKSKSNDSDRLS